MRQTSSLWFAFLESLNFLRCLPQGVCGKSHLRDLSPSCDLGVFVLIILD